MFEIHMTMKEREATTLALETLETAKPFIKRRYREAIDAASLAVLHARRVEGEEARREIDLALFASERKSTDIPQLIGTPVTIRTPSGDIDAGKVTSVEVSTLEAPSTSQEIAASLSYSFDGPDKIEVDVAIEKAYQLGRADAQPKSPSPLAVAMTERNKATLDHFNGIAIELRQRYHDDEAHGCTASLNEDAIACVNPQCSWDFKGDPSRKPCDCPVEFEPEPGDPDYEGDEPC